MGSGRQHHASLATLSTEVEEFLKAINLVVGLDQLLEILCARLRDMSGADSVFISLFEPVTNRFTGAMAKGNSAPHLPSLRFSPGDRLVKWLTVNQSPLDVTRHGDIVNYLTPREQELLRETRTVLIFPFIAVNRLTGIAFLTTKADGRAYTPLDIDRMMLIANHSALAIEHAMIYQFQEARLKKILHADKLATVGELAAGAAHEIRNPLTSIRSTAQFLKKALAEDKHVLADGIVEEVDRIDHIIAGLLSLSKSTELKMVRVDLTDIIRQTLLLLDPELRGHAIIVEESLPGEHLHIDGDAAQLKQLFINLLLNSIQAMPDGGTITLKTTERMREGGQHAMLDIALIDTGKGIAEADLEKVFDPFFTTKEEGTGLGLSISYGIVSKHGGEIRISSSAQGPMHGTSVTISFPNRVVERGEPS
jgi:two-component system, NtrC family, sensor kinase